MGDEIKTQLKSENEHK